MWEIFAFVFSCPPSSGSFLIVCYFFIVSYQPSGVPYHIQVLLWFSVSLSRSSSTDVVINPRDARPDFDRTALSSSCLPRSTASYKARPDIRASGGNHNPLSPESNNDSDFVASFHQGSIQSLLSCSSNPEPPACASESGIELAYDNLHLSSVCFFVFQSTEMLNIFLKFCLSLKLNNFFHVHSACMISFRMLS